MTTAAKYLDSAEGISEDILFVTGTFDIFADAVQKVDLAASTPGTAAGILQGIAATLTIQDVVLTPLKLIPYGIGQAVKQFDRVTGLTVDEINA